MTKHHQDKKTLQKLNQRLEEFVTRLPGANRKIKDLQEQLEKANATAQRKLREVSRNYEHRMEEVKAQNEELNRKFDDIEARLKETVHDLRTKEQALTDRTAECKKYKHDLGELENLHQEVKHECDETKILLKKLEREQDELKEDKCCLENQVYLHQESKAKADKTIQGLRETVRELKAELQDTKDEVLQEKQAKHNSESVHNKNLQIMRIEEKKVAEEKLKKLELRLAHQYEHDKKEWISMFRQEVDKKMREAKDTNRLLLHQVKTMEDQTNDLSNALSLKKAEIDSLNADKNSLEERIKKMDSQNKEKIEEMTAMNKEIRLLKQLAADQKRQMSTYVKKIQDLMEPTIDYKEEIDIYQRALHNLQNAAEEMGLSHNSGKGQGSTRTAGVAGWGGARSRKRPRTEGPDETPGGEPEPTRSALALWFRG